MEEILAKTTTPDGWEVENTTMYMDEKRCIMGSPHLAAVYKDAEGLAEEEGSLVSKSVSGAIVWCTEEQRTAQNTQLLG